MSNTFEPLDSQETESLLIDALPTDLLIRGDIEVRDVYIDGKPISPAYSQRVRNHSPDGFNWGYGGSGPAQLSLAILLKFLPKDIAQSYYQSFKFAVVAGWPKTDFEIHLNLRQAIQNLQKKNTTLN